MRDRAETLANEIVACNQGEADMDLLNRVSGWSDETWSQVDRLTRDEEESQVDGESISTAVQLAVVANLAAQAVAQEVRFVG